MVLPDRFEGEVVVDAAVGQPQRLADARAGLLVLGAVVTAGEPKHVAVERHRLEVRRERARRRNRVGDPDVGRRRGVADAVVPDPTVRVLHAGPGEDPVDPVGDLGRAGDHRRATDPDVAQRRRPPGDGVGELVRERAGRPVGHRPPPGQQPGQQCGGADVALGQLRQRRGDQLLEPLHPPVLQAGLVGGPGPVGVVHVPRRGWHGGPAGQLRGLSGLGGPTGQLGGLSGRLGPDQPGVGEQVGDDRAPGDRADGAHLGEHAELVEPAQGTEMEQRRPVAATGQAQADAVSARGGTRRGGHVPMQPHRTDTRPDRECACLSAPA